MKIENIVVKKIEKTESKTENGEEIKYSIVLEKDEIKVSIKTDKMVSGLLIGDKIDVVLSSPQKTLELEEIDVDDHQQESEPLDGKEFD